MSDPLRVSRALEDSTADDGGIVTNDSWSDRLAGYRAAERKADTAAEETPVMVPYHLASLLETIAAQQAEQTMLLQEILAALRARD